MAGSLCFAEGTLFIFNLKYLILEFAMYIRTYSAGNVKVKHVQLLVIGLHKRREHSVHSDVTFLQVQHDCLCTLLAMYIEFAVCIVLCIPGVFTECMLMF